jgi:hypothetical protein
MANNAGKASQVVHRVPKIFMVRISSGIKRILKVKGPTSGAG